MSLSILYSGHLGHTTHRFTWGWLWNTDFDALCPSFLYDCNITIRSSWISRSINLSSDKAAIRLQSLLAAGKSNRQIFAQHFKEAGPDSLRHYFSFDISINHWHSCHYHLKKKHLLTSKPIGDHVQLLLSLHYFLPVIFAELPVVWASSPYNTTWGFWEQGHWWVLEMPGQRSRNHLCLDLLLVWKHFRSKTGLNGKKESAEII